MKKCNIIFTAAGVLSISAVLFTVFWTHQSNKPLPAGTVDKAVVNPIVSVLYSEKDYDDAVECVKDFFPEFENCELKTLRYGGDLITTEETNYYSKSENGTVSQNNTEYIILLSDFYVNPEPLFHSCNDAWNHDSTYTDWKWILARTKDTDNWKIITYGYD